MRSIILLPVHHHPSDAPVFYFAPFPTAHSQTTQPRQKLELLLAIRSQNMQPSAPQGSGEVYENFS